MQNFNDNFLELGQDLQKIEKRHYEIDKLIKELSSLTDHQQKLSLNINQGHINVKQTLKTFYSNYTKGGKNITIRELFSKILKVKLKSTESKEILKDVFKGSKNFISKLEKGLYQEILTNLEEVADFYRNKNK